MRLWLLLIATALAAPDAPSTPKAPAPATPEPATPEPAPPAPAAPAAAGAEAPATPAPATPAKPATPKPATPKTAKPASKPASTNLPAKRAPDPEVGQRLYEQSCVQCHGPAGRGDGPIAADVVGGVPDLSGRVVQDQYDAPLDVIQGGRGRMPAFSEVIDRQDARRVLVYLSEVMAGRIEPGKAGASKPDEEGDEPEGN